MPGKVLLTGASGYVGGRLLRLLSEGAVPVRCLARHPEFLSARVTDTVEVVRGDVLDRESLTAAMAGVETAYYFVHSMGSSEDFEEADRRAARNFAEAAREAGVERIIYLGGLGEEEKQLSPHLRSRHEVGQLLGSTGVQVIEFRASIVLGSGSLSFEMIRALVEKLPIMITPRWVAVPAQPIAIEDLLNYLVAALHLTRRDSRVSEIGGADQVSYGDGLLSEDPDVVDSHVVVLQFRAQMIFRFSRNATIFRWPSPSSSMISPASRAGALATSTIS
jgi:uncharacterized protein YbjT (DUF2867 family)